MTAIVLNALVGFALMHTQLLHGGLALANNILLYGVAIALSIKLLHTMQLTVDKRFIAALLQYGIASGIMGVALCALQRFIPYQKGIVYTFMLVTVGILLYAFVCKLLNPNIHLRTLLDAIRKDT